MRHRHACFIHDVCCVVWDGNKVFHNEIQFIHFAVSLAYTICVCHCTTHIHGMYVCIYVYVIQFAIVRRLYTDTFFPFSEHIKWIHSVNKRRRRENETERNYSNTYYIYINKTTTKKCVSNAIALCIYCFIWISYTQREIGYIYWVKRIW